MSQRALVPLPCNPPLRRLLDDPPIHIKGIKNNAASTEGCKQRAKNEDFSTFITVRDKQIVKKYLRMK